MAIPLVALVGLASSSLTGAQTGHRLVKIVGAQHAVALMSDGVVLAWGTYRRGEIGPLAAVKQGQFRAMAPVAIKLPRKAIDVAAGENSSFALLDDGTVAAWGSNMSQMLGVETSSTVDGAPGSETPVLVPELTGIVRIAAGGQTALALRGDGTVYGWGRNLDRTKPALMEGLANIKSLSVSDTHSMALDGAGAVWTFGGSMYGSLGRMDQPGTPMKVPSLSGIVSISAGNGVSTVVKKDGTVWVWGSNYQGQFGDGDRTAAPVPGGLYNKVQLKPQQVAGVRNAVVVASGTQGRHTLVLLADGSLRGWGNTDWGQLGGGVSGNFQLRVMTPKITGVRSIFAVGNTSFAIKKDGTLWAWGLGDRDSFPLRGNAKTPVKIALP